jgi:hypothetical protein
MGIFSGALESKILSFSGYWYMVILKPEKKSKNPIRKSAQNKFPIGLLLSFTYVDFFFLEVLSKTYSSPKFQDFRATH